ncbi:MAG TPA: DUF1549 and DUF1553 domain-containing protein [Candidatus Limnocylindria bacterium]|nr:DUF1549 and DUF1553 domain-containing protein [Candidatus Limnocylindria bacterium]
MRWRLNSLLVTLLTAMRLLAADTTNHWSFLPVARPEVPPATSGTRNPIDRFIQARLAGQQLSPAPEADRRTLIRRLSFDLVGLPPTPAEADEFVSDPRPDAYERLVDRLLDSPHFGERWARHWLDVVRFAETHGFEMNNPRPNAWPYRDYVIRAFNDDKPYDRFVREQLAGDALGADEATGFLVAGAWDQVKSPDEVLTKNQRADELHDMVSVTGSAFLGLTIGCARCHDHKFDPIPQHDYYAFKAVFEGVQHGERARRMKDGTHDDELKQIRTRLTAIDSELLRFEPLAQVGAVDPNRLRGPVHPRRNVERFAPFAARRLRFTVLATTGAEPCLDELEVFTPGSGATNVALASLGTKATASGTYPNSELHRLEHLNDGRYGNSRSWISSENGRGWVELEFPRPVLIERVVWSRDREEKFGDRLASEYRVEVAGESGGWRTVASSSDRRPFVAGQPYEPDLCPPDASVAETNRLRRLLDEQKQLAARTRELTDRPMVYAGDFRPPEVTRRFQRGDPLQPREEVLPGALTRIAMGVAASNQCLPVSATTEEQRRRLALADWIASPANPLTARVIVNRIWQHHFTDGLVTTPSDFGVNGARPTHPELLDWLAAELMSHGWSLKHIHRLIVTSATYRQASEVDGRQLAAARPKDGGNRLLWRYPAHRLEAEPIRDAMLAVAGRLDLRMGGPGWSPFVPNENYVRVYVPKDEYGPEDFRRMVYATVVRQRPDGVFGAFDCPDGGQIAPKRPRSTTPLQALNLLNSGFIQQAARLLADHLTAGAGAVPETQAREAFQLAFQREPTADEVKSSAQFIRAESLPLFCRALLNSNEFVFVF